MVNCERPMPQRTDARLPEHLTLAALRSALAGLRLIPRTVDAGQMLPEIPRQARSIIDGTRVRSVEPEAAAFLGALLSWIRTHQPAGFELTIRVSAELEALGISSHRWPSGLSLTDLDAHRPTTLMLPPVVVELPASYPAHDIATSHAMRRNVRLAAQQLAQALKRRSAVSADIGPLASLLDDFLEETLLNVYEHAYLDAEVPRHVWCAASIQRLSAKRIAAIAGESSGDWFRGEHERRSSHVMQVTVADAGLGIPNTLAGEHRRRYPEQWTGIGTQYLKGYARLHSAIIDWAVRSPFSSRKHTSDFSDESLAQLWRGLYRISDRAAQFGALLTIQSGFGTFASQEAVRGSGSTLKPWPGTLLTLRVGLPASLRVPVVRVENEDLVTPAANISIAAQRRTAVITGREPTRIRDYCSGARLDMEAGLRTEPLSSHINLFAAVVHPNVMFSSVNAVESDIGESHAASTRGTDTEAMVVTLVRTTSLPGVLPVHLFLDCTPDILEAANNTLGTLAEDEPRPAIAGFIEPGSSRVSWVGHCVGVPDEAHLFNSGDLSGASPVPLWLRELAVAYRSAVLIEETPGQWRAELTLPGRMDFRTQLDLQREALSSIGSLGHCSWLWKSDVYAHLTASGHAVAESLIPYELLVADPLAEAVIVAAIAERIGPRPPDVRPIVIVPPGDLRYLFAKRVLRRAPDLAAHLEQWQSGRSFLPSRRYIVLTDVLVTGRSLQHMLDSMPPHAHVEDIICCADLRAPNDDSPLPRRGPVVTSILLRWPCPRPLKLGERPTEDTGEATAARFATLETPCPSADAAAGGFSAFLNSQFFVHGLARIGKVFTAVRYDLRRLLMDVSFREVLAQRVADTIALILRGRPTRHVIVCVRDESSLLPYLPDLGRQIDRSLRRRGINDVGLRIASLTTIVRGPRQTFAGSLETVLRTAVTVDSPSVATLLDEPVVPLGEDSTVVFLDNSAITGRAAREFCLKCAGSTVAAVPRAILLMPIINRLSPAEDEFVDAIAGLSSGLKTIKVFTDSVVQLRTRYYPRLQDAIAYQLISNVLSRLEHAAHEYNALGEWTRKLKERWKRAAAGDVGQLQVPLAVDDLPPIPLDVTVIRCRQLIGLEEQGIAIRPSLVIAMKAIIERGDHAGLITMFAVEPELLSGSLIAGAFLDDILRIALQLLEPTSPLAVRLNALWVLLVCQQPFVANAKAIARRALIDPDLTLPWLGLVLAGLGEVDRNTLAERVKGLNIPQTSASITALHIVEAERTLAQVVSPQTMEQARDCLYGLLRECRPTHVGDRFSGWWQIGYVVSAMKKAPAYLPPESDLAGRHWIWAESFLSKDLLPAIQALRLLYGDAISDERSLAKARLATVATFSSARRLAQSLDPASRRDFVEAWETLETLTFEGSLERAMIASDAVLTGRVERGIVAGVLATHVIDPFLAVLTFLDALRIPLRINGGIDWLHSNFDFSERSPSDAVATVRTLWSRGPVIPLVMRHASLVRQALDIVTANIHAHADQTKPIVVRGRGTETRLIIEVLNRVSSRSRPGSKRGLVELRGLMRAMDGEFTRIGSTTGMFGVRLSLPVRDLRIPFPGAPNA
jgi:hypothetical protein